VAGNGKAGYSGDGAAATSAMIADPTGVAVDLAGNLYFTDFRNNRIRKVTASTGVVNTIAGNGSFFFAGDAGPALSAGMDPYDIAVDSRSNIYVADRINSNPQIYAGRNYHHSCGHRCCRLFGRWWPGNCCHAKLPYRYSCR
jgi:hypothetical protein